MTYSSDTHTYYRHVFCKLRKEEWMPKDKTTLMACQLKISEAFNVNVTHPDKNFFYHHTH